MKTAYTLYRNSFHFILCSRNSLFISVYVMSVDALS